MSATSLLHARGGCVHYDRAMCVHAWPRSHHITGTSGVGYFGSWRQCVCVCTMCTLTTCDGAHHPQHHPHKQHICLSQPQTCHAHTCAPYEHAPHVMAHTIKYMIVSAHLHNFFITHVPMHMSAPPVWWRLHQDDTSCCLLYTSDAADE